MPSRGSLSSLVALAWVVFTLPLAGQDSPPARRVAQTDTLFGHRVTDPYRWMEQSSDELTGWIKAQDGRARAFAAGFAGRQTLRDRISRAANVDRYSPVAAIGDHFYVVHADGSFSRRRLLLMKGDRRRM
jgi:prolyl oligopeptidase